MYDVNRIGRIISDIKKYQNELNSYGIKKVSDLKEGIKYHASAMLIFAILNRVLDLGNEILANESVGAPNTYLDIMPLLSKAGYINKEEADELNKIIEKRNVMAHFYYEINEKDLFKVINKLYLIDGFIQIVKKRIKL